MSWWRPAYKAEPHKETEKLDQATRDLERAVENQKSALTVLLEKFDQMDFEAAIDSLNGNLGSVQKNAK
jgi:hypothetical protein